MCFLPGLRVVTSLPDAGWGWRGAALWLLAYPGAGVLTGGPCELLGNASLGPAPASPSPSPEEPGPSPGAGAGETLISAFLNPKIHLLAQASWGQGPTEPAFPAAPHHRPRPGVRGGGGGGRRWGPHGEEKVSPGRGSCLSLCKGRSLRIGASYLVPWVPGWPGRRGGEEGRTRRPQALSLAGLPPWAPQLTLATLTHSLHDRTHPSPFPPCSPPTQALPASSLPSQEVGVQLSFLSALWVPTCYPRAPRPQHCQTALCRWGPSLPSASGPGPAGKPRTGLTRWSKSQIPRRKPSPQLP